MEALTALRSRRSIRKFTDRPISRKDLETLVDCARLAATGRGVQPWEFVVVTAAKTRQELAKRCEYGAFIAQAPAAIVIFCADSKYYLEDGCNATENILIAATALGIGSCWVAGDKKPYAEELRSLVGAPEGYHLIAIVALGYAALQPEPKKRPLDDVLHWEKF